MSRIMDKPNKIKAKLIVEVEAEFYDDESSEETVRYCVEQDLEDIGYNVLDVSVMN
jgi:predicted type IV restriction endonuclease